MDFFRIWRRWRRKVKSPHIEASVELSGPEAAAGTTKTVAFRSWTLCGDCGGSGQADERRCRRCSGRGLGSRVQESLTIRIPPGTRSGTVVRVAGRGVPGVVGRPRGDLRLKVRITNPRPARTRQAPPVPQDPPAGGSIVSEHVQVVVDQAGFTINRARRTPTGISWSEHLSLRWPAVRSVKFETDRHDPVVSLYVYTTTGQRHHAMDSSHLSRTQWPRFADMIARSSGRRVTLDLATRDDPRSMRHDI